MARTDSRPRSCLAGAQRCCAPTRSMLLRRLALALFLKFFDFALDEIALEHAEMLDEKNAVEVVDFVAEGAGQKIFAANLERFALGILRFYRDELRADDVAAKAGNGEAALFFALFAFGAYDFGVGEDDLGFGVFSAGDVNDGDANGKADLWRGEADALRSVHGGEHIFGKLFEAGIEVLYGRCGFFEDGIAVFDDLVDLSGCRDGLGGRGLGGLRGFRTRRFVEHSYRNSAASRRANLLQIFAEKHRRAQEQPSLLR